MNFFELFLLILFLTIHSTTSSNTTTNTTTEYEPKPVERDFKSDIKYLMDICIDDEVCKFLYHINEDYKNYTVFVKIVLPYYNRLGRNLENSVYELYPLKDNNDDNNNIPITENFKKDIILFQMIKNGVENGIFCGQNQIARTYLDGSMSCVCSADSDCNTPQSNLNALYYLIGVLIFGISILVIVYFIKDHQVFSFISNKIYGSKK